MPVLEFVTEIKAPIGICFDLARSIDFHKASLAETHEEAVGDLTSGLIGLGQEVTWKATHLGIRQKLSTRITELEIPDYFQDEMTRGSFKMIKHEHRFEEHQGLTVMWERFEFESPFGVLGRIFNKFVLNRYLKKLIVKRNMVLKSYAESACRPDPSHAIAEILMQRSSDSNKN